MLALLLAGCSDPPTEPVRVDPPAGTEHAVCPPPASRGLALAFRAEETPDARGRGAGLHRLDAQTFLWVWASYQETLREDDVTRVNAVDVATDGAGLTHVCTRVDIAAPTEVDAEPRTYDVAVLLRAQEPLPEGPVRVVVNWVAGCAGCSPLPRGNATAVFE